MKKIILLMGAAMLLAGCSIPVTEKDFCAGQFSSHVGCPKEEVKIIKSNYGMAENNFLIECRGKQFYCSRQNGTPHAVKCTEAVK